MTFQKEVGVFFVVGKDIARLNWRSKIDIEKMQYDVSTVATATVEKRGYIYRIISDSASAQLVLFALVTEYKDIDTKNQSKQQGWERAAEVDVKYRRSHWRKSYPLVQEKLHNNNNGSSSLTAAPTGSSWAPYANLLQRSSYTAEALEALLQKLLLQPNQQRALQRAPTTTEAPNGSSTATETSNNGSSNNNKLQATEQQQLIRQNQKQKFTTGTRLL